MTDRVEEPSSLLDWATGLVTDPALRSRFAAEPRAVLDEQGLTDVPPADLHHSLPLVTDSVAARVGVDVGASALTAQLTDEDVPDALARQIGAVTDSILIGTPAPDIAPPARHDDHGTESHDLDDIGGPALTDLDDPLEMTTMTTSASAAAAHGMNESDFARVEARAEQFGYGDDVDAFINVANQSDDPFTALFGDGLGDAYWQSHHGPHWGEGSAEQTGTTDGLDAAGDTDLDDLDGATDPTSETAAEPQSPSEQTTHVADTGSSADGGANGFSTPTPPLDDPFSEVIAQTGYRSPGSDGSFEEREFGVPASSTGATDPGGTGESGSEGGWADESEIPAWLSHDDQGQWYDNSDRSDIVDSPVNPTDAPGTPQGWNSLTLEARSQGFPDAQAYLAGVSREDMAGLAWEPGNRNAANGELQAFIDAADAAGMSPADYGAANTYTPEQIDAAYAAEDSSIAGQDNDLDDFGDSTGNATDTPADPAGEGAALPSWISWDESQQLWVDNGSPDPGAAAASDGGLGQTDSDLDGFGEPGAAGGDNYVPHGDDAFGDMLEAGGGSPAGGGDVDLDGFGSGSIDAGGASGASGGDADSIDGGESFGSGGADGGSSTDSGSLDDPGSSDAPDADSSGGASDSASAYDAESDSGVSDAGGSDSGSDDGGSDDAGASDGGESFG